MNLTLKVLDTTAISAMLFEVGSLDLMERCCQQYNLLTSQTVLRELERSKRAQRWKVADDKLQAEDPDVFNPAPLAAELAKRYPMLHEGELTAFLIALRRSVESEESVVFVTDDGAMRRKAPLVVKDSLVAAGFGTQFNLVQTGTVGLVVRMAARGLLSDVERKSVADDLENSSFRCSTQVLDQLRC